MRKILFRSHLSLGDIVMLTAAVRDLHRCYPNQFLTSVDTTCSELWDHNPWISPMDPRSSEVETIKCEYPLIQWSNQVPYHFLHGFIDDLNAQLKLEIRATEFRGDIYVSRAERGRPSPIAELCGDSIPYWLILAGGKHDVTIKWWDSKRYQEVVDAFRGRIQFVQLGQAGHFHPKLDGVIDLRGRTSLRDLIRLVYRAQGVLCGVTGLMHLAAAVPAPPEFPGLRPCVVVAGGREPVHWESYPGHEYIHTVGQLRCCSSGGCWRSRTSRLGDGDPRDHADQLCLDVREGLPHCMHLIESEEVIHRIERFFKGRRCRPLNVTQQRRALRGIEKTRENPIELQPLTPGNVQPWLERCLESSMPLPRCVTKQGIILCVGDLQDWIDAWIAVRSLRHVKCQLPIELWHLGIQGSSSLWQTSFQRLGVKLIDGRNHPGAVSLRTLSRRELKSLATWETSFEEVLVLDPNTLVTRDPKFLFDLEGFQQTGVLCWGHKQKGTLSQKFLECLGVRSKAPLRISDGAWLLDRSKCNQALRMALWLDRYSDFFLVHMGCSADGLLASLLRCGLSYERMPGSASVGARVYEESVFEHRLSPRWSLLFENPILPGGSLQKECLEWIRELASLWKASLMVRNARVNPVRAENSNSHPESPARLDSRVRNRVRLHGPARLRPSSRGEPLTIVMLYDASMADVGRRAEAAWAEYASARGYGFVCFRESLDSNRHPSWSKVLAVQRVLKEQGKMVFWVDADTLPMNFHIPVHERMPEGFDIAFASDGNGLNCGHFLSRPTTWAIQFWETVYFLSDVRRDPDGFGEKWEQNTVKAMIHEFKGFEKHVCVLPQRVLNACIGSFRPGDFALHFAVMSNRERLRRMQEAQQWVVR